MAFFWGGVCKFGFGKCFGASSQYNQWAGHRPLSYKIYFSLHITIWLRNSLLCRIREDGTSKQRFFFICIQLMRHPVIELFHISNFPQMPNDHKMVDIEFLGNFSCSCKRISFDDCSQLVVVNFSWPVTLLLITKALVSFVKLFEPPLHCTFVSSSWAKWVGVVSCLRYLQPIWISNKKNCSDLLFV